MGRVYRPMEVWSNGRQIRTVGIIDTGADETVISSKLAKMLRLKLKGKFRATSASKHSIEGKYAILSRIVDSWFEKSVQNYPVGVTDEPFEDDEGIEIIIGVDFLQDTEYELRFENK